MTFFPKVESWEDFGLHTVFKNSPSGNRPSP